MTIEIIADTHEPGSLETLLWFIGRSPSGIVYSTGDHIPSGMGGPERKIIDELRAKGVKDVSAVINQRYAEDPNYKKEVDEHYEKTIANQGIREQILIQSRARIISCAGNQDFVVGKKMKERYGAKHILHDFEGTGLDFVFEPRVYMEDIMAVLLVPYKPSYNKDKRPFEEIRAEIIIDPELVKGLRGLRKVLLLSHQSIDCTAMGLPAEAKDAYTEPGNRALITAHYEFVRNLVGAENIQLVHGHHHKPYKQYEFRGSKVHNLNIGDLLLVDPYTFKTEISHVVQY